MNRLMIALVSSSLLLAAIAPAASAAPEHHSPKPAYKVKVVKTRRGRVRRRVVTTSPAPPTTVKTTKVVYHRPPPRRVVRKKTVVVYEPAPPPVVVVEEKVVVARPAPRATTVVRSAPVVSTEPAWADEPLALGLRIGGASIEGDKVGLSHAENPGLGGVGVHLRTRFDDHWGLELSLDALGGSGEGFEQTTVPVMGALTYHLWPSSRIQPYGLAGAGVHFSQLDYLGGQFRSNTTELAGQVGAGLEIFLTEHLSLEGDIRGQSILKNLDSHAEVRQDCLEQVGAMSGFCDGIHAARPDDKLNMGVLFQAGINLYF